MARKVIMVNQQTKVRKIAYEGFSWTAFFFTFWPPLFRGDIALAALVFAISMVGYVALKWGFVIALIGGAMSAPDGDPTNIWVAIGVITLMVIGIQWVWGEAFNGVHMNRLREKGFVPLEEGGSAVNMTARMSAATSLPPPLPPEGCYRGDDGLIHVNGTYSRIAPPSRLGSSPRIEPHF